MKQIKTCEICGFQTDNGKIMSNHKRWKHIIPKDSSKYYETIKKISNKNKKGNYPEFLNTICPECGKPFISKHIRNGRYKKYCSPHCANLQGYKTVSSKPNFKQMLSESAQKHKTWIKNFFNNGLLNKKSHSKRELEIVNYFKTNFPNDEWKQGSINGRKKYKNTQICPDLWSKKLKIIIEYDGVWHFKDIHNQLKKKQKIDKITMDYCKENGYRIIRIDEDKKITNEQIVENVYKKNDEIILLGDRYNYLIE